MNVLSVDTSLHKYPYRWNLADLKPSPKDAPKVVSTFACGGGSTMGYKLAGYDDVIGANDIDPKMEKVYVANHHPKTFIRAPIAELLTMDLPDSWYGVDVLDGSPPCSTFSMAGQREKNWGKEKAFREGQAVQELDRLFFDFIDLVERLRPKVVVAENVKGMLAGRAKLYLAEVCNRLSALNYEVQVILANAALLGVPQARERVFVIGSHLKQNLSLSEEPIIPMSEILEVSNEGHPITEETKRWWRKTSVGKCLSSVHPKGNRFTHYKIDPKKPLPTISSGGMYLHPEKDRHLNVRELEGASSWPSDYNFEGVSPQYLMGMSVPPVMMAHVADSIRPLL